MFRNTIAQTLVSDNVSYTWQMSKQQIDTLLFIKRTSRYNASFARVILALYNKT